MATIIDKPDALSLSGNMRRFVLGAKEAVSFILKKGTATSLEQSYEPGPDKMVRVPSSGSVGPDAEPRL